MLLTDDLLMHGQRCQRRAFLETYGDRSLKQSSSDYLSKIMGDSRSYRRQVLAHYNGIAPDPMPQNANLNANPGEAPSSWESRVQATADLMAQGVEAIVEGQILRQDSSGLRYLASPDLLIKRPGTSRFGDWSYVPILVKLGRRPKLEYQLLAVFQAFVLADFQSLWPAKTGLILRDIPTLPPKPYWVSLRDRLQPFQELLQNCQGILLQRLEPEVFIARNRCSLCLWLDHCTQVARSTQHLSLLPGITPKRYHTLKTLGIQNLETLADTSPQILEPLAGFGVAVTRQLLQQARSTLAQQPLLHTPPEHLLHQDDPVEFYFDIESQPDLNLVYLHGVLLVQGEKTEFYPFLAENPETEQVAWTGFLELMARYPYAPIYHFCPYEVDCIRRLGQQFRIPGRTIDRLVYRCIDLHALVTGTVTLPIESYALKSIARWLGFNWRQEDVNGAQAICWYSEWLRTNDRSFLEQILIYNEDDCRATYRLKSWLAAFFQDCYDRQPWILPFAATNATTKPTERSA